MWTGERKWEWGFSSRSVSKRVGRVARVGEDVDVDVDFDGISTMGSSSGSCCECAMSSKWLVWLLAPDSNLAVLEVESIILSDIGCGGKSVDEIRQGEKSLEAK